MGAAVAGGKAVLACAGVPVGAGAAAGAAHAASKTASRNTIKAEWRIFEVGMIISLMTKKGQAFAPYPATVGD